MAYDTVDAIRSWPFNSDGWHVEPETNRWITLGDGVMLGDGVTLGNCVGLGDGVMLGDGVRLGDGVTLGNEVRLGNWVRLGDGVTLPSVNIARYRANPCAPGIIRIGCEIHTVEEWRRTAKAIASRHDIEAEQIPAMLAQLNWLAGWFEAYPEAMKMKDIERSAE